MELLLTLTALVVFGVLLIVTRSSITDLRLRITAMEDVLSMLRASARASALPPMRTSDVPRAEPESAQPVTLGPPPGGQGPPPSGPSQLGPSPGEQGWPPPGIEFLRPSEKPDPIQLGLRALRRWFTVGNVPVKVGMLVLLAGVAALLKYASEQGWLHVPIELRLAGVSAAALLGLLFGWRHRADRPAFALALQGGATGVLLLTVFAAFKLYALLPQGVAFGLSVVLIAGAGVLSVLQDSRTLAMLSVLAGFLAPIWLSTGSDSHVVLFSYYAVLNAAVLAIAWVKPWRLLNLIGFAFTWGIGTLWGVLQYDPSKLRSVEPFLLLFFAFYLAIPILYARRRPAGRGDLMDACLVFGTPLIAFSLQAGLLHGASFDDSRMPLAFCALALAVLYAGLAWGLLRRERYEALGQSYAILAVGFATLAVPLALSAHATAAVFALEGASLVWLSLKLDRLLPHLTGIGLQLLAALAYAYGSADISVDDRAVANPGFMGGLILAMAGFASAWACRRYRRTQLAAAFYVWAVSWWFGTVENEVGRFVVVAARPDVLLEVVAITGWLAAEVHRRTPAAALALTTGAGFAVAVPLAFAQMYTHGYPFGGNGGWAWLLFALLGVRALVCLRDKADRFAAWAQLAWWLVWPTTLSLLARHICDRFGLADGWLRALWILPWLAAAAVSLRRWRWLSAPQGERFDAYRTPLQSAYFIALALWWLTALAAAGNVDPLPWVPAINPTELAQLAVLVLVGAWVWTPEAPESVRRRRLDILAGAGFVLVTCMTLRTVHHWSGIEWNAALVSTSLAQTSLTVVWSVLGVIGWISGSRRGQRGVWLAGAVLMGVVLAKLVFVDRQHLGNLLGIGSFIAYGLLCTLVGYFAPAPPRETDAETGEITQ